MSPVAKSKFPHQRPSLDEAIPVRIICANCGVPFDEYLLWPRNGTLIPARHPANEPPDVPGWRRIGPPRKPGQLSGAGAPQIEQFAGVICYRWRCAGGKTRLCHAAPKIAISKLVGRVYGLAMTNSDRPIEIAL